MYTTCFYIVNLKLYYGIDIYLPKIIRFLGRNKKKYILTYYNMNLY